MMKIICCILVFVIGIYIGKLFGEFCALYCCKGYSISEAISISFDKAMAYNGILPVSELYKEAVDVIRYYDAKCIDETLSSLLEVNDSED